MDEESIPIQYQRRRRGEKNSEQMCATWTLWEQYEHIGRAPKTKAQKSYDHC